MEQIINEIKNTYIISEKYTEYIYKIQINNVFYVLIILYKDSTPWNDLKSFKLNEYQERVISNYRLCSKLNIGPKLYRTYRILDVPILITEYLPIKNSQKMIDSNKDSFKKFISNIHKLGIYHGDLHGGNFAMNSNYHLKIIDLETLFYADEIDIESNISFNPLIKEWIDYGFEIDTIKEFIDAELNKNWMFYPED